MAAGSSSFSKRTLNYIYLWNEGKSIDKLKNVILFVQIPAGLFIPSMFVGACLGRVIGIGMEQIAVYVVLVYIVCVCYTLFLQYIQRLGLLQSILFSAYYLCHPRAVCDDRSSRHVGRCHQNDRSVCSLICILHQVSLLVQCRWW